MKINTINKIKEYFFRNPTERLRVRHIERKAKVPLPSAIKYAKELEKEGILKSTIIADIKLYSADRTSKNYLHEKKLSNLKSLFPLVQYLIDKYSNPTIVMFGSYSRGEDVESSDIDIYLETPSKEEIKLEQFEKELGRSIQIFRFKNIQQVKNKDLANNIINGITLNGFLEVL